MSDRVAVTVPFEKKKLARDLHIAFSKEDRKWYASEETAQAFYEKCSPPAPKSEDTDTSGHTYMREQYYGNDGFSVKIPTTVDGEVEEIPTDVVGDLSYVFDLDASQGTLKMALQVKEHGLPALSEERAKVLRILGNRSLDQYPITYDGMISCSDTFRAVYPEEKMIGLVRKVITGAKPYMEEIRQSDLSEEEKALLYFALPM